MRGMGRVTNVWARTNLWGEEQPTEVTVAVPTTVEIEGRTFSTQIDFRFLTDSTYELGNLVAVAWDEEE